VQFGLKAWQATTKSYSQAQIVLNLGRKQDRHGRVVMESGWESKGPGFKPRRLQATFDPRLPKNLAKIFPALQCAFYDLFCKVHFKIKF